ncbi:MULTISPECIES: hypothetical protein [Actinoplanes]|uniref:hypothetical protein n=1 Tax=Actinoplanes TaxID=1865 RepID=UPI000A8CD73E|nr:MULTISPECIES: hypothetical protein [Actinoplanes]GLY03514.1 hypothetical protein Acsp01_38930 [Actinoplanes sp. NBRC 101535]
MSDNVDPAGNTEAFRAFTRDTPEAKAPSKAPLIIGGVVAAVVVIAVIAFLVL